MFHLYNLTSDNFILRLTVIMPYGQRYTYHTFKFIQIFFLYPIFILMETVGEIKKSLIDVRLPDDIYPAFVSNYRSDLIIGPSTINKVVLDNKHYGNSNNTAAFESMLQTDMLYSNLVQVSGDITFNFTNVKIPQDKIMVYTCASDNSGLGSTVQAYLGGQADANKVYGYQEEEGDEYLPVGMSPNPFQEPEMVPCSNFLNAYLGANTSIQLASNGGAVQATTTPRLHDYICRTLDKDFVREYYDGILTPTKSITRGQRYLAFTKSCPYISNNGIYSKYTGPAPAPGVNYDPALVVGQRVNFKQPFPTYRDVELDENCASNARNRGQLDTNLETVSVFSKTLPSPNYNFAYNSATNQYFFTATAPTTTLRTATVNGYTFPSHVNIPVDMTDDEAYELLGDLYFWFYDGLGLIPQFIPNDDENPMAKVIFQLNEPAGQALNITKTYKRMVSPLYNPILSMSRSSTCISNTNVFKCNLTKSKEILNLIEYMGNLNLSLNGGPNDVGFSIADNNIQLTLTQYGVQSMASSLKKTTNLYYSNMSQWNTTSSNVLLDRPMTRATFTHTPISIGSELPTRILLYIDNCIGSKIVSVSAMLNNGAGGNALEGRTIDDLYQTSKHTSLQNYTKHDYLGYKLPYDNVLTKIKGMGVGSFVEFNLSDFGFSSQVLSVAGLSGKEVSLMLKITADIPLGNAPINSYANIVSNAILTTNSFLQISNSQGITKNSLFDSADVVHAIENFKQHADTDNLHMSSRRFLGGSIISSLLKARHIIPKVFNFGRDAYNAVKSGIDGAAKVAHTVSSGLEKINNVATHGYKGFFK